jgi:hypothetical protein
MIYSRLLQSSIRALLVMALNGCANSATPPASASPTTSLQEPSPFPTAVEPLVILTPTQLITNFEQCVNAGGTMQRTYPRQCISYNDESFEEVLPEGIVFSHSYGNKGRGNREDPYFIMSTLDGGYLITGIANDSECLVRKINSSGQEEWAYRLGRELSEEFQFVNASFNCWSAAQSPDGEYRVLVQGANGSVGKFFLIKFDKDGKRGPGTLINYRQGRSIHLDKDGNLLWLKSFGLAAKVIETSDGGYAFVGRFPNDSPDSGTHIFKTDANETYLWETNLCRDQYVQQAWQQDIVCSYAYLRDAIQSQDGSYVLAGGLGDGVWLLKTDPQGSIEWIKSYPVGMSRSISSDLIQTSDGGFLMAGAALGDGILIKMDAAGNLQWSRMFGGSESDEFRMMEQHPNDEIVILGLTESFGEARENTWLLGIDLSAIK